MAVVGEGLSGWDRSLLTGCAGEARKGRKIGRVEISTSKCVATMEWTVFCRDRERNRPGKVFVRKWAWFVESLEVALFTTKFTTTYARG